MSLKVGIVGAAGYAGAELIRLVLGHPEFELAAITSNADAGQPLSAVHPSFTGVSDLVFTTHDAPELKNCDAGFLAVPHTAAMAQVPARLASGVSCFDLSADYRLNDASVFEAWYAAEHTMWQHSPLKYANMAKTPTLFIQSDEDYRCWMGDAIQMFSALKYFGVEARLCLFHGENHELSRSGKPKHRIRRMTEMMEWFEKYLK